MNPFIERECQLIGDFKEPNVLFSRTARTWMGGCKKPYFSVTHSCCCFNFTVFNFILIFKISDTYSWWRNWTIAAFSKALLECHCFDKFNVLIAQ